MKTKIRKSGIAALTAALLVTAALIASCSGGGGGGGGAPSGGYQPPAGMGYATISVGNTIGRIRTVAPPIFTATSFTKYDLTFERFDTSALTDLTVKETVNKPGILATALATTPFPLNPGFWELTVVAYKEEPAASGVHLAVAEGKSTREEVKIALPTDFTVHTELYSDAEDGNGTFSYKISLQPTTALTTVEITIKAKRADTAATLTTIESIALGATGTKALPAGYYYLDVLLSCDQGSASLPEALHIYKNLTSELIITFTDDFIVQTTGEADPIIDLTPAPNTRPILEINTVPATTAAALADGEPVPLDISDGDKRTVTVTNFAAYDTIEWWIGNPLGSTPLDPATALNGITGTNNSVLTITAGAFPGPFGYSGTKAVTVIGTIGTGDAKVVHSTIFFVKIDP